MYRALPYLACILACAALDLWYFPPRLTFPDEMRIFGSAVRFATSGEFWVSSERAWEMPGAALFFAPAVWLFGPDGAIVPIRLAQAALLAAQCGCIGFLARRLFPTRSAGLIAAWIAALYPFFLYYQGLLLSETLFNTFLLAGLAALYAWRDRGARFDLTFALAVACFALATYTKASLTVLPPLLFGLIAWASGTTLKRSAAVIICAAALYGACLSPWWIRNAIVLGEFVPFTTSSASNLYLGNNPANPDGGIDWATNAEPDLVERINRLPGEVARQRAYSEAAVGYILAHPEAALRTAGKKFLRFWNIVPNAAEYRGALYALISAASFGPILVLAIVGATRQWRNRRNLAPLYAIIGYFTLVHVVTIASLRYRLPIEPLLIVLAAEPLAAMLSAWRKRASAQAAATERGAA